MRVNQKQAGAQGIGNFYGTNFHKFVEMESRSNGIEIAEELGISLGEVKKLKEKLKRA